MLYNYSKEASFQQNLVKEIADSYGCSYVPATYLKHHYCPGSTWQKPLPTFKDLHPLIGKPLYHLFELGDKSLQEIEVELTGADADSGNLMDWTIREYTLDELQSDTTWEAIDYFQEFADLGRTSSFDNRIIESDSFGDERSVFAPKYRLIFAEI